MNRLKAKHEEEVAHLKKDFSEVESLSSKSLISQRDAYERQMQEMKESLRTAARSTPVNDGSHAQVLVFTYFCTYLSLLLMYF